MDELINKLDAALKAISDLADKPQHRQQWEGNRWSIAKLVDTARLDIRKEANRIAARAPTPPHALATEAARPVPSPAPESPATPSAHPVAEEPGALPARVEEDLDSIDATMFSGDAFQGPQSRARLRYFTQRWERQMASDEEQDAQEAREQAVRGES